MQFHIFYQLKLKLSIASGLDKKRFGIILTYLMPDLKIRMFGHIFSSWMW